MSNAAKVHEFLNKAQTFCFLTTDGDQPKGRPFGFQMLVDDKVYFGCGTFKNVFKQLTTSPKVEVLAVNGANSCSMTALRRLSETTRCLRRCAGLCLRSWRSTIRTAGR